MFEYHGWINIQESTSEVDEGNLANIIDDIRSNITKCFRGNGFIDLRPINGSYHLCLSGFTNHKAQEEKDIINLFYYIGERAHGSYGLLYMRDDEDINGLENEFIVYTLYRGNISFRKDIYLSPIIPTIEDPELY
ncbi:MAG: Imm7 family immunity protein [Bacillota bacterium]